ncbi:MAG TPA: glutathione S-transferase family protein [Verrucomicrobiae bacterium]|nr:glutathione S-transferase family protein [Verrucomicrobiae bacterium]
MRLHGGVHSGYTQKVRIALAEKGLAERVPFALVTPEERRGPAHRARHPLGLVPVLELDDGSFLPESTPIIEYLDALFPEPPLIPVDPLRRARMHALDHYNDQALTPPVRRLWPPVRADAPAVAAAKAEVAAVFGYLDGALADGPYLVGEFSIADIAFMPRLQMLSELGIEIPPACTRVQAWHARLASRASWARTMFAPLPRQS